MASVSDNFELHSTSLVSFYETSRQQMKELAIRKHLSHTTCDAILGLSRSVYMQDKLHENPEPDVTSQDDSASKNNINIIISSSSSSSINSIGEGSGEDTVAKSARPVHAHSDNKLESKPRERPQSAYPQCHRPNTPRVSHSTQLLSSRSEECFSSAQKQKDDSSDVASTRPAEPYLAFIQSDFYRNLGSNSVHFLRFCISWNTICTACSSIDVGDFLKSVALVSHFQYFHVW